MQYNPWYYTHTGQRHGPVSNDEIRKLIIERKIQPEHCKLWQEGMENWVPINELEAFRPSLELIERLDKQANLPSKHKYCSLQAALDARRPKKRDTIFTKHPHLALTLRVSISLFIAALLWAWTNESVKISHYFAATFCTLVTLIFAGTCPEKTIRERSIVGGLNAFGFLLAWYLGYLTNHGAKVGESLLSSVLINQPFAFLAHYIDAGNAVIVLVTFTIPFLFVGLFYRLLFELAQHRSISTGSISLFED